MQAGRAAAHRPPHAPARPAVTGAHKRRVLLPSKQHAGSRAAFAGAVVRLRCRRGRWGIVVVEPDVKQILFRLVYYKYWLLLCCVPRDPGGKT